MKRQVKKGFLGILIAVATMAITLFAGGCKNVNVDEWFCDHKYNDGIVIVDAGCSTDGTLERTCTECGKKKTEPIIAVGHEFDEGEVVVAPSCTVTGVKEYTCSRCGEVNTETLPTIPHNKLSFAGTPATCTETGLTEGYKCADCNTVLIPQSVIPAKGHKSVIDYGVSATCFDSGLTKGSHCERCGEVLEAQEVIEALGHSVVVIKGYEATCTETGLTDGTKCHRCNTVYTEQEIIPVSSVFEAHSFENNVCVDCGVVNSIFLAEVGDDVSGRVLNHNSQYNEPTEYNADLVPVTVQEILSKKYSACAENSIVKQSIKISLSNDYYVLLEIFADTSSNTYGYNFEFYCILRPDNVLGVMKSHWEWNSSGEHILYDETIHGRSFTVPNEVTVVSVEKTDNIDADYWTIVDLMFRRGAGGVTV